MHQSRQNVITSSNVPQYQYRSSQNIGLPINSRLVSDAAPNVYLNNYQSYTPIVSPQQVYAQFPDPNAVRVSNVGYQSIANPVTSYTIVQPSTVVSDQVNTFQTNVQAQRSTRNVVRSRLVPVTQYVPVYQIENVQTVPQTIHQRVILHEPEAFKERTVVEQKVEALPTLIEQYKVEEVPEKLVNTKVVRVSQDPLVQTVPGGWKSKVNESKVSYVAPAPLPREEKACCSGWLLLLLGLLALSGVLTAILLGKNTAASASQQKNVTVAAGTKVSSGISTKIQEVQPLTNASFEVRGKTAVTKPVTIQPTTTISSIPLSYVPATDISVVAKTQSTVRQNYVEPQKTNLVAVTPLVVHPEIVESKTITTSTINAVPVQYTTSVTRNNSVLPITYVSKVSSANTQNLINQAKMTQLRTVSPATIAPIPVTPVSLATTTTIYPLNATLNATATQINRTTISSGRIVEPYHNRTAFIPASEVSKEE